MQEYDHVSYLKDQQKKDNHIMRSKKYLIASYTREINVLWPSFNFYFRYVWSDVAC